MKLFLKLNNTRKRVYAVLVIIGLFTLFAGNSRAQSVKNVSAKVLDDIIVVSYDLVGNMEQVFTVNLYSSKDNFKTPLTLVTGDVGPNIKTGNSKRIEWLAKNELSDYSGSLIFEVRALLPEPAFDPLKIVNFNLDEIKSGKKYEIQWTGGKPGEKIDIFLYEDGQQKSRLANVDNSGKYLVKIPKGSKDSNYRIQLDGESGIIGSSQFKIKSGISPYLIGGGALIVGGIVAVIFLVDGGGGTSDDPGNLPEPPNPE